MGFGRAAGGWIRGQLKKGNLEFDGLNSREFEISYVSEQSTISSGKFKGHWSWQI